MKFSVCIDALYATAESFTKSMKDVKNAGINAVEFWDWSNKDIAAINKTRKALNLEIAAFCTANVSLVDESVRTQYIKCLKETVATARTLDCRIIMTQVGQFLAHKSIYDQNKSLIDGLCECAEILKGEDITLVFEPLNTIADHHGYYLTDSHAAAEIADRVGSKNIKVLFDIYHQQISEGNIVHNMRKFMDNIGHIHAAGCPGRHELTDGEINYPYVFRAIEETGYQGFVGMEYFPLLEPSKGLRELLGNI